MAVVSVFLQQNDLLESGDTSDFKVTFNNASFAECACQVPKKESNKFK